jgi:hypothetical protein
MTEAEWLASKVGFQMLEFLGKASERKLRLFSCACVRRQWALVPPIEQPAVEVAERFADGLATKKELTEARTRCLQQPHFSGGQAAYKCASPTASNAARLTEVWAIQQLLRHRQDADDPDPYRTNREEGAAHADLIRDIFGNPFRRVRVVTKWRTSTVLALAQQVYDTRDFSAMPILADALQDTGCDRADILDHCRGPGPHVRGCWVVDLVLGKA